MVSWNNILEESRKPQFVPVSDVDAGMLEKLEYVWDAIGPHSSFDYGECVDWLKEHYVWQNWTETRDLDENGKRDDEITLWTLKNWRSFYPSFESPVQEANSRVAESELYEYGYGDYTNSGLGWDVVCVRGGVLTMAGVVVCALEMRMADYPVLDDIIWSTVENEWKYQNFSDIWYSYANGHDVDDVDMDDVYLKFDIDGEADYECLDLTDDYLDELVAAVKADSDEEVK